MYDLFFRRRIYQFIYKNYFQELPYKYDYVLPAKGFSNKARINWLNRYKKIKDSRILIIGVGNGYGIPMWLRYQPKEIVGNDILNYEKAFEVVRKESKSIKSSHKHNLWIARKHRYTDYSLQYNWNSNHNTCKHLPNSRLPHHQLERLILSKWSISNQNG